MGKMKENPRYNILSVRVSDDELVRIREAMGPITMQEFLHHAIIHIAQSLKETADTAHD